MALGASNRMREYGTNRRRGRNNFRKILGAKEDGINTNKQKVRSDTNRNGGMQDEICENCLDNALRSMSFTSCSSSSLSQHSVRIYSPPGLGSNQRALNGTFHDKPVKNHQSGHKVPSDIHSFMNDDEKKVNKVLYKLSDCTTCSMSSEPSTTSTTMAEKYKTTICSQFISKGHCSYGKACIFAHGYNELRYFNSENFRNDNANYNKKLRSIKKFRTEICQPFITTGVCKYGERCMYAHSQDEVRIDQTTLNYKTKICINDFKFRNCTFGDKCAFIHRQDKEFADLNSKGNQNNELMPLKMNNRNDLILNFSLTNKRFSETEEGNTPGEIANNRKIAVKQILENLSLSGTPVLNMNHVFPEGF
ncbi:MAG: hypothetical protein MHMPM18_000647 [Marteilia pararefringens]